MPTFFSWRGARDEAQPGVAPRTDEDVRVCLRLLPRYRVLLHNDDVNSMDYVVVVLLRTVPSLSYDDAIKIMLEAHRLGSAQVIVCPKETAEFYREQLEQYTLTSTIEPA